MIEINSLSELNEALKSGQQEEIPSGAIDAEFAPSEPIRLESEEVFDPDFEKPDPDFLEEMESLLDNPMAPLIKMLSKYMDSILNRPRVFEPIQSEHKVRIFRVYDQMRLTEVESQIESILNEGWCCHHPVVINDYIIMDFSRRKESEEDEKI